MSRRLKTIAKYINESLDGYEARIVGGYCNTDRKFSGSRLRWPGKGRTGNRLQVRRTRGSHLVLDPIAPMTKSRIG